MCGALQPFQVPAWCPEQQAEMGFPAQPGTPLPPSTLAVNTSPACMSYDTIPIQITGQTDKHIRGSPILTAKQVSQVTAKGTEDVTESFALVRLNSILPLSTCIQHNRMS